MIDKDKIKEVARQRWRNNSQITLDELVSDAEILYVYGGSEISEAELRDLCLVPTRVEDCKQWRNRDYWPIHVSVCLLFDINPDVYFYCPTDLATTIREKINRINSLVNDAIASNKLKSKEVNDEVCIEKYDWLNWINNYTKKHQEDWIETFLDHHKEIFIDEYFDKKDQTNDGEQLNKIEKSRDDKKQVTKNKYSYWQEEIDKLSNSFPNNSHIQLCRKLSKILDVAPETIRRQTKKRY